MCEAPGSAFVVTARVPGSAAPVGVQYSWTPPLRHSPSSERPERETTMGRATNKSRMGSRCAALLIAAGLLAATVTTAPVASAAAEFDVWNLSGGPVKVQHHNDPRDGSSVPSGKNYHIAVSGTLLRRDTVEFTGVWAMNGQRQYWSIHVYVTVSGNPDHIWCVPDSLTKDTAACGNYIGNNVAIIADAPGTRIDVPAADKARQKEILDNVCGNGYKPQLNITCGTDAKGNTWASAGNTVWTLLH
jgi:hypothetical protein